MYDLVIKYYLASLDRNLRIPYMEKIDYIDGMKIICSLYKNNTTNQVYCVVAIINNGEYIFDEVAKHSGYYPMEEALSRDIIAETFVAIKHQFIVRRQILTFLGKNKNLPSILSVGYNKTLVIYYLKDNKFRVTRLERGVLTIDLKPAEQVFLADVMNEFGIRVERSGEERGLPYGLEEFRR